MRSTKQSIALLSTMLMMVPVVTLGRSPLTDSTDVKIPTTRSEVENSIAVSPLNSKVLLVSNISYPPGGVTSWISLDAGKNWLTTDSLLLAPSLADPAAVIGRNGGTNGRFFVNHIDSDDKELGVHYKNTTGGTSWTHVEIDAGKPGGPGTDKNHMAINNNTSGSFTNRLITAYNEALATGTGIKAYYSTDNGASWTATTIYGGDGSKPDQGVNLQWSPPSASKVYACWAVKHSYSDLRINNVAFRYSDDGGDTWDTASGGQNIQSISGFTSLPEKSMPVSIQAPVMTVNMDNGHLFIVYVTKPNGYDADVYVIKSMDEGETWGSPVLVHAATSGKDQWQPWISWDDCTGAVVVTFLDARDYTNNDGANTYMSVSYDSAATWTDFKVSDAGWNADNFSGHYMGVAAKDGVAFPVWSDDREVGGTFKPYISPIYLGYEPRFLDIA